MTTLTYRYTVLFIVAVIAFLAVVAIGFAFDHMTDTWYPHHTTTHSARPPAR